MEQSAQNLRDLTAEIVSAYVTNNTLRSEDVPNLITTVYQSLDVLGQPAAEPAAAELMKPVSIKKSIQPDYVISMEDGRQYKSLKRHLTGRGLTPATYREKWGLRKDYPMVAPNYAKRRSELAKSFGLGQARSKAAATKREAEKAAPKATGGRKKGGRAAA